MRELHFWWLNLILFQIVSYFFLNFFRIVVEVCFNSLQIVLIWSSKCFYECWVLLCNIFGGVHTFAFRLQKSATFPLHEPVVEPQTAVLKSAIFVWNNEMTKTRPAWSFVCLFWIVCCIWPIIYLHNLQLLKLELCHLFNHRCSMFSWPKLYLSSQTLKLVVGGPTFSCLMGLHSGPPVGTQRCPKEAPVCSSGPEVLDISTLIPHLLKTLYDCRMLPSLIS